MDTITTTQDLLKFNGSARPVTVALTPNETRLIAAAPDLLRERDALRADNKRLHECLTAANMGDVPLGWDDAIAELDRARAELAAAPALAASHAECVVTLELLTRKGWTTETRYAVSKALTTARQLTQATESRPQGRAERRAEG